MNIEIEQLVLKRRKEIYSDLVKQKQIRPEIYFIVHQNDIISEINIPDVAKYFEDSRTKASIPHVVADRWRKYSARLPMDLIAVVIMSDTRFVQDSLPEGVTREEYEEQKKNFRIGDNPNAIEAIMFNVYYIDKKDGYLYPYKRIGRRVVWMEKVEGLEIGNIGLLKELYPEYLKTKP